MSVTEGPDDHVEAAYLARSALDQAQDYADLVADYAQMKYLHEGGEQEEQYLSRLVEDDSLPFGEEYDPDEMEEWDRDPADREEILESYEERIESFFEDEAATLTKTLRTSRAAKNSAEAEDALEASEHRHYAGQEVDPTTVAPEHGLADDLVDETDSYTIGVFGDQVKARTTSLAKPSPFDGFSPSDLQD